MLLNQLQNLVREVARTEVMPRFLNVDISEKEDGSMLSEADLAAQAAFAHGLPAIIDSPMLGEEMTPERQHELWQQTEGDGLWVVDPIDGTNNFINGIPHFALSVAYVKNGRAQLGVVYNPVSDECFYAERGGGAYLNGRQLPLRKVTKRLNQAVAGWKLNTCVPVNYPAA